MAAAKKKIATRKRPVAKAAKTKVDVVTSNAFLPDPPAGYRAERRKASLKANIADRKVKAKPEAVAEKSREVTANRADRELDEIVVGTTVDKLFEDLNFIDGSQDIKDTDTVETETDATIKAIGKRMENFVQRESNAERAQMRAEMEETKKMFHLDWEGLEGKLIEAYQTTTTRTLSREALQAIKDAQKAMKVVVNNFLQSDLLVEAQRVINNIVELEQMKPT